MEVLLMGLSSAHGPEFIVDRPRGLGSYLLMCFSTPFRCATVSGIREGGPGDCVLHDPAFPQWHGPAEGATGGFCNDWIHVSGSKVRKMAERYRVPFNRIIRTGNAGLLSENLGNIERERFHRGPFWREYVELEFERALLGVSRHSQLVRYENELGPREREYLGKFRRVREELGAHFDRPWTSAELARACGLSIHRFSTLYRKFFGISPIEDLISIRMVKAKALLMNGGHSVGETAEACGFASLYYFSRTFRQRVGCSPTVFQKGHHRVER